MTPLEDRLYKLKLVLDETVSFPSEYLFKFIVPVAEISKILIVLQEMEIEQKASSHGKYISVSGKLMMQKSDDIILIYEQAAAIKGIISL